MGILRPLVWLRLGWRDLRRYGWVSLIHGVLLAAFGSVLLALAHDHFWLLAGAFSGFLVVAPALATSVYALSRAIEQGQPPTFGVVLKTWSNWQGSHFDKWGRDYWCMFQFGALLALAATGWVLTSAALITLLAPVPIETPMDFLRHVVLAPGTTVGSQWPRGWLFELWLAIGGVLAAPIFASSVVAMPLLLDRRVTLLQAVLTSWQTVLVNPLPLSLWAALILVLTLLGFAPALLGLVVVLPWLGHASWHAYRELVDTAALPPRDAATDRPAVG